MPAPETKSLLLADAKAPASAFVGFDGFVDSLYKVIKGRSAGQKIPYSDIPEFAAELMSRAGKSGGLELSRISVRAGGNAPLMAAGLCALGVRTACVAAMGRPGLSPAFEPLGKAGCELVSVAEAAATWALEFDDGKFMLNDSVPFESLNWRALVEAAGLDKLKTLVAGSDLLALVDWANMPHATNLWRGLLEEVLAGGGRRHSIFFDLADISRHGEAELKELAALLPRFKAHGDVYLGLNENEALKLAAKLGLDPSPDLEKLAFALLEATQADCVVVHPRDRAVVVQGSQSWSVPGRVVAKPLLSTGGGDHFNAGFCFGLLKGLPPHMAAEVAVRVSGLYVEMGKSPDINVILSDL